MEIASPLGLDMLTNIQSVAHTTKAQWAYYQIHNIYLVVHYCCLSYSCIFKSKVHKRYNSIRIKIVNEAHLMKDGLKSKIYHQR